MKVDDSIQFDEYLTYDRKEAYLQYNDKRNRKVLKAILYAVTATFTISAIVNLIIFLAGSEKSTVSLLINFTGFAVSLILLINYNKIFPFEKIRKRVFIAIITAFILFTSISVVTGLIPENLQSAADKNAKVEQGNNNGGLSVTINTDKKFSFPQLVIFFMVAIAIFSFTKNELIQLATLAYAIPLIAEIVFFRTQGFESYLIVLLIGGLIFVFSYSGQQKRHKQFLARYDYYYKKGFETIRMKKELDYAREIQISMLPPSVMTLGDISILAHSEPAMEVGGDYFDYFRISDNEIGVFICDVSGHGVASALMLSGLRSSMHVILEDSTNPRVIFEKLNRMIRKTQTKKMFVTAVFGVINSNTNRMSLFNAGHLPPYKIDGMTKELLKITRHGVTLGALDEIAPETMDSEVNIEFNKGDKLIFYTDGLTEAMNSRRNEFGFENIEKVLYANLEKSSSDILNSLRAGVNKFSGDMIQQDDVTIMIISRN
ncbi:MAG TPA: PP2C family protein-serine/threonine phosphatase [Ignavibacteria bacterium]|nr:PP2C family protein-serine/threonine phosphatase [Ignavibacteria bacterium]